jgi:hypothetical protein
VTIGYVTTDDDVLWVYEDQSPPAIQTERRVALGLVIEQSTIMEDCLRTAFCSLLGGPYAAVVAGGQGAEWLIANCKAVARVHRGITEDQRAAIKAALEDCSAANQRRNTLVHGLKAAGRATDGSFFTFRSRKGSHRAEREPWTAAETQSVAAALWQAAVSLTETMEDALPEDTANAVWLDLLEQAEPPSDSAESGTEHAAQ